MGDSRGPSFGGAKRNTCTICYIITWGLLLLGTIICHMAIAKMIDPLADLPDNIKKGFYDVLKFDGLETSADIVRTKARDAIQKCDNTLLIGSTSECPSEQNLISRTYNPPTATTTAEKTAIDAEFTSTLNIISKVANDQYFGIDALQETANDLSQIQMQLANLTTDNADCRTTTPAYCLIYKDAKNIVEHTSDVKNAIDDFYDNDAVTEFTNHKNKLVAMHALPYVLFASMAFFFCFWYKDAKLNGASMIGLSAVSCFAIWWLVFIIWNTIMVALGIAAYQFSDSINIPGDVLKGNPTYHDLVTHVETEYPGFYNLVLDPLSAPFKLFLYASVAFEVVCIVIVLYGCCICCWTPYTDEEYDTKV